MPPSVVSAVQSALARCPAGEAQGGHLSCTPSTERPHREMEDHAFSKAKSLITPTPQTPLYDQLSENLANSDQPNVLQMLADVFLCGTVEHIPVSEVPLNAISAEPPADTPAPYALASRLEATLGIAVSSVKSM